MPGYITFQDFINKTTNLGQIGTIDFTLTTANAGTGLAGVWQESLSASPGQLLQRFAGLAAGTAVPLNNTLLGTNLSINSNVSPAKRYLIDVQVFSSSNVIVPGILYLCDFLLCYPNINITSTIPTVLNNSATLPRYTDGVGVQAIIPVSTALTTSTPAVTLTCLGNNGIYTAGTLTAASATAPVSQCFTSNTTATRRGSAFCPLSSGVSGITAISSYTTITPAATGSANILLVKPLVEIPLLGLNSSVSSNITDRDYFMQFPTYTEIKDGACLGFLISPGGALGTNSVFKGRLRYGWS